MLPRIGRAKQKTSRRAETLWVSGYMSAADGRRQPAGDGWCNLRLKRSKRCRIKGLVCVCRHLCMMVQPRFQLISTLKAKVHLHVVRKGCRHRLKSQCGRFSNILRSESETASSADADACFFLYLSLLHNLTFNSLFYFYHSLVSFTIYGCRAMCPDGPFSVLM